MKAPASSARARRQSPTNNWAFRPGGGLEAGAPGWELMLHEFGHALGLAHPHDEGFGSVVMDGIKPPDRQGSHPFQPGDFDLNSTRFTVMSYRGAGVIDASKRDHGYAMGPMAFDIAVLQEHYGATRSHPATTATSCPTATRSAPATLCLWDTGGEDTIRAGRTGPGRHHQPQRRDPAYEPGGGGFLSSARGVHGGFTIANGVRLENATGGDGDDTARRQRAREPAGRRRRRRPAPRRLAGADRLDTGDDNARDLLVYRSAFRQRRGPTREPTGSAGFDARNGRREATWDRIDLSGLDGDADAGGNQPLRFVEAFSAPGAGETPGQVRAEARGDNMHVLIDLDGDSGRRHAAGPARRRPARRRRLHPLTPRPG